MNSKEKIKNILTNILKIRLNMNVQHQELQDFLYYQHLKVSGASSSILWCGICGTSSKEVSSGFKRAFKTLSHLEQAQYYFICTKNTYSILEEDRSADSVGKQARFFDHQQYKRLKLVLKQGGFVKKQSVVNVQLLHKEKILKIVEYKIQIDLHRYLFRKSKGSGSTYIVLEATYSSAVGETIRICSYGFEFDNILDQISALWEEAQYQNILNMVGKRRDESNGSSNNISIRLLKPQSEMTQCITQSFKICNQNSEKKEAMNYLSIQKVNQNIGNYLQIINSFANYANFEQIKFGESYQKKGQRVRKNVLLTGIQNGVQLIEKALRNQRNLLQMKSSLKQITITKIQNTEALQIQQIHLIDSKLYHYAFSRKLFNLKDVHYVIDFPIEKTLKNKQKSMVEVKLIHNIWRLREVMDGVQVLVEAKVDYGSQIKGKQACQKTCTFMGDLSEILQQQKLTNKIEQLSIQSISQEQVFYTLPGSFIDEPITTPQHEDNQSQENHSEKISDKDEEFELIPQIKQKTLITSIHSTIPHSKGQKDALLFQNGHWLWKDQWVVNDDGELVSIDQQKIAAQSSVLKLVLMNMGKNIFSGKSILNTCLPIQIFGTDSNLERLAKGYIFAPHFLQKAEKFDDPVERMKYVICFGVGFSLAYIEMEKPFNPILGETYQGLIDGCPVYAEQISHHPPISSLYMKGRGYIIYGNLEAKVDLGLNSAAGVNEGFNNVEFTRHEGTFKFTSPPGEMSGLVYGDRKITVTKKSYYIDQKNQLYCQIQWGKNKSSKDPLAKYKDFFYGKILKLKSSVNFGNLKSIKKDDIVKDCGQIRGRLTSGVYFNEQLLFDVEKDSPYRLTEYNPCLVSDSRNRLDIIHRKQNDYNSAQTAKEQLQIFQRKDKKLRQQYL